jgi:hypothetical protein
MSKTLYITSRSIGKISKINILYTKSNTNSRFSFLQKKNQKEKHPSIRQQANEDTKNINFIDNLRNEIKKDTIQEEDIANVDLKYLFISKLTSKICVRMIFFALGIFIYCHISYPPFHFQKEEMSNYIFSILLYPCIINNSLILMLINKSNQYNILNNQLQLSCLNRYLVVSLLLITLILMIFHYKKSIYKHLAFGLL